jgi:Fe-only nitrogenase accessory protein AnfO|nr:Fe-only nitrogenase accessory AnfO family protein [uncultured Methanoregula sp.]
MCIAEIATFLGEEGTTIPLNEPGTVTVFRRERGAWVKSRERAFALNPAHGLRELRQDVSGLLEFFGGCRVLVVKSASGALYFELEKARCSIWEISGVPKEFLDEVWHDEKASEETLSLPADAGIPSPLEISPGRFSISILEIQGKRPEVSSKQVLQRFVQQGAFLELEIVCDHMPPWIEMEAERRGIRIETTYAGPHEVRVVLRTSQEGAC